MKQIYYNGMILTMESPKTAEALVTEGEKILAVGRKDDLDAMCGKGTEFYDLQGKTLMPAFIDAHSHLSSYAMSFLQADLENTHSFQEIMERLAAFEKKNPTTGEEWLKGSGYDHNALEEHSHPTAQLLDRQYPDIPVLLSHKSGHFGVMNSCGLQKLGLLDQYPDGYLEESHFIETSKRVPMPSFQNTASAYQSAQKKYASYGITTIQEGMMVKQMIPMYKGLLQSGTLFLDTAAYMAVEDAEEISAAFPEYTADYQQHFRLGGYKMILDGSPQGRTAWMRTPYLHGEKDYFSGPVMSDEDVSRALQKAVKERKQILAHCNGDAAAAQFIRAAEKQPDVEALRAIRPVIIHAQLLGIDQLPAVKALGLLPSFFVAHVYYWGDVHIENFGFERASEISPAASTEADGIHFTFHQDTPVIQPDMLETVWCAGNRLTKAGVLLGKDQRLSVFSALKAITIDAAYQYHEEAQKGSLKPGKKADLVILDKNPLTTPVEDMRSIHVIETVKDGKRVFPY